MNVGRRTGVVVFRGSRDLRVALSNSSHVTLRTLNALRKPAACSLVAHKSTVQQDPLSSTVRTSDPPPLTPSQKFAVDNCEAFKTIDLAFTNHEDAYRSKSNLQLLRALVIFRLCKNDWIVENSIQLMRRAERLLGRRLFKMVMRASMFGHFVAGEDEAEIKPCIEEMRKYGVKSILDYSVECDISTEQAIQREMSACTSELTDPHLGTSERFKAHEEFGDRRKSVISARTYFYEGEAQCERNTDVFMNCISAVSGVTNSTGFAAVKLTALGRPQLLMQLSDVIIQTRQFFEYLVGTTNRKYLFTHKVNREMFTKRLRELNVPLSEDKANEWFSLVDTDNDDQIDLSDWSLMLKFNINMTRHFSIPNVQSGTLETLLSSVTKEEAQAFSNLIDRLLRLCQYAVEKDVRVMVDAEQTYFQPAINRIVIELMKRFNKEKAVIFNTYQCYLKDTFNVVSADLDIADKRDFYFGAKIVRGAYMDQERSRAESVGYEDPINNSCESTNRMYQAVLEESMRHIVRRGGQKVAVMIASHNEDTVRHTIKSMKRYGILPDQRVICFGQLYGMCDQVSYSLGQAGFSVYKYVPYGPVNEVLPYLSRRSQENRSLLKGAEKERTLLWSEFLHRIKHGKLWYKPKPPPLATV